MSNSFFIYTFFYFFVILSTLGYGLIINTIVASKKQNLNLGYSGIFGFFFLIIYSYLSNFFIPHEKTHNLILLLIGICFSVYLISKYFQIIKKDLIILISIFLILFFGFILFKNHDDFSYYHFPYSYLLTQNDLLLGLGQFGHGFRTPSSIFYINSIFYLPFVNYNLFHISPILIMGFVNFIFLSSLIKTSKYENNFNTFYCLLALLFINIFFYRISEHGTDRSAQILIFLLIYEIILFTNITNKNKNSLNNFYIVLGLIISLKAFYIIYIVFLIPIIIYLVKEYEIKNGLKILLYNFSFPFFIILISLVLITNLFNTGCFIYPASFTCFEIFDWSISTDQVDRMKQWYEQWSKAGATPNFRVENPAEYIENFNWVENWISLYFFNKISDFLLGLIFASIIIFLIFRSKDKNRNKNNYYLYYIYFIIVLLLFEWFINHPALRYGGYTLISLLFFLPLTQILHNFKKNKNFVKKMTIVIILIFSTFIIRNIHRVQIEIQKYNFSPFEKVYYRVEESGFRVHRQINKLINNFITCEQKLNECNDTMKPRMKLTFGKYTFLPN